MDKLDFSFVVITYNQQEYVLEALESIKYQIENYGQGLDFEIIIGDDGSIDRTVENIDIWLNKNKQLFAKVKKVYSKQNQGITVNVLNTFREISSDYYFSIAGDDMLSDCDVIKKVMAVGSTNICMCPPYVVINDKIDLSYKNYSYNINTSLMNKKEIIKSTRYDCPIFNGCIVGRKLINDESLLYSTHCKLLDDRPRYYKLLRTNNNYSIVNDFEPVLIYRKSEQQVTSKNSDSHKIIIKDVEVLTKLMAKETNNIFIKYNLFWSLFQVTNNKYYIRGLRLLDFRNTIVAFKYKMRQKDIKKIYQKMTERSNINNINGYINLIKKNAQRAV